LEDRDEPCYAPLNGLFKNDVSLVKTELRAGGWEVFDLDSDSCTLGDMPPWSPFPGQRAEGWAGSGYRVHVDGVWVVPLSFRVPPHSF
jgi:hypothetical protein